MTACSGEFKPHEESRLAELETTGCPEPFHDPDNLALLARLRGSDFSRFLVIKANAYEGAGIYGRDFDELVAKTGVEIQQDVEKRQNGHELTVGHVVGGAPWSDPIDLPAGLPPVQSFTPELLPGALRPWVTDIAERMQCPLDFPAVAAMVCLAAVVGRQIGIRPKRHDDWLVVPNLWGAVIGRPGLLKTPALAEPMRCLMALEAQARDDHEHAMRTYETQKVVAKMTAKEAEKRIAKAIREGKPAEIYAQQAIESAPAEPVRERYITSDVTVEKLGELLAQTPRGILIYRDELIGFLRGLDREGREGSRAFFLEAWNGTGRFVFDRIGRGTIDIEAACVSILGGIQPGPLTEYVSATRRMGSADDGLIQRFQLLVWPDSPTEWRNVDRWPNTKARQDARALFEQLTHLDVAEVQATPSEDETPSLRFDPDAQDEFDAWRSKLEYRLRSSDDDMHPALEAHLAKYRSLIPSIALLCHLADCGHGPVSHTSLLQACAWGEYLESHARRVYATVADVALTAARELDRRIISGALPARFAARDVYRQCWRHLDRQETAQALEYLADLDRVRPQHIETAGRTGTIWEVNPALIGAKNSEKAQAGN